MVTSEKNSIVSGVAAGTVGLAGAIASLTSIKPITIQQAEAVNKSYPKFFQDFEELI